MLLLAALTVPLLIAAEGIEGLGSAEQVRSASSRFITIDFESTDGIDLHYLDSGQSEGPVFILLHGSMYNAYTWQEVFEPMAELGRTVAYDQIPFGLSEKLTEGSWSSQNPYTQSSAIRQLISLLDGLGIDKAVLVGNSYGGTLAVRAAQEYPQRVEGLILVDPALYVNESMPSWLLESRQMHNLGPAFARMLGTSKSFFTSCYADQELFDQERKARTLINTNVED